MEDESCDYEFDIVKRCEGELLGLASGHHKVDLRHKALTQRRKPNKLHALFGDQSWTDIEASTEDDSLADESLSSSSPSARSPLNMSSTASAPKFAFASQVRNTLRLCVCV